MAQITLRDLTGSASAVDTCFTSGTPETLFYTGTGPIVANDGVNALSGSILNETDGGSDTFDGDDKWYISSDGCDIIRISGNGEIMEIKSPNDNNMCVPTITLNWTSPLTIAYGSNYVDGDATVIAECDPTATATVSGTVDTTVPGDVTITYSYTNAVNVTGIVTVSSQLPTFDCTTANITIPDGDAGDPVVPTIVLGTLSSVTPSLYQQTPGPNSYDVVVTIPSGYLNSGTISCTNISGNTNTPADTTAPTIILSGSDPRIIEVGDAYTDAGATASDNIDGDITSSIVVTGLPINNTTVGNYTISYDVSDSAGNNAATVTRIVEVKDTTIPVITLSGDNPLNINVNDAYSDPGYTATDNYDDSATLTGTVVVGGDTVIDTAVGQYNVTYNVTDSNGNNAVEKTRVVNVNDGAAPIPEDETYNVSWNGTLAILLVASDNVDSSGSLTYTIVSQPTKGTLTQDSSDTFTYEHTSLVYGQDSFTFTATDAELNTSNPGTITLNPLNSAPVLTDPGQQTLDQNTTIQFDISISDADGDTITIIEDTPVANGTVTSTASASELSVTYTPTVGHSGADQWIIKGRDSKGEESPLLTINFVIEAVPYFEMDASSFGNDPNSMCIAPRPSIFYGGTTYANNVDELAIGDFIYTDENLNNKVTGTNASSLITVSDTTKTKILNIGAGGQITSMQDCTDTGDSSSTGVYYATSENAFCDNDVQYISIWYDGATADVPLETLVANNTPLFISEYYSSLYNATAGETISGTIASGIYGTAASNPDGTLVQTPGPGAGFYKRSALDTWGEITLGDKLFTCDEEIPQSIFALEVKYLPNTVDPTLNQFCAAEQSSQLVDVSLFYSLNTGDDAYTSVKELARSNNAIYKSQLGAQTQDQLDLFESNIFSDTTYSGAVAWDNSGDGKTLNWYGNDTDGLLTIGGNISGVDSGWISCTVYNSRPVITNSEIISAQPSVNSVNAFYAFYSSNPEIEGPEGTGDSEDLFWPIYVIDGLHTYSSGDSGSHIKDFIDTLSIGNIIESSNINACLTYAARITAEDMDDAIFLLKNGLNSQQRPVVSSGIELGFSSEEIVNVYAANEDAPCILGNIENTLQYTFPFVDGYDSIKAGPNFNTETNYRLDNVAKPLLRTNPKLSGNIKIVTDSGGSVYLESINANEKLAGTKYKKQPINPNGNYGKDVATFFKSTGTPSDLIYLTKRVNSDLTVHDSYDKQIEEEYQYGTSYNYSKNYDEDYKIFAPMWADNNMPNNFIIFKVKDPSGVDATHTGSSNSDRIGTMLKNAEIIKSFDLSKKSSLGKYIRSHVQQETFPKSPLTVSFNKNETTNYNGIDLKSGELTSKGEYIYKDYVETDKPLIEANDFITDGFKRNDMLCANLLNLEFLFDDDTSQEYDVNRYFGLYVDTIDSGVGEINSINNNNVIKFSKITSLVDQSDPITAIPSYRQMSTSPTLGYVKINEVFYKISNTGLYDPSKLEVKVDDVNKTIKDTIGISYVGRSVNLTKNEEQGFDFVKMSIIDVPDGGDKIAVLESREESYKFTFIKHTAGESINIQMEDSRGTYDLFNESDLGYSGSQNIYLTLGNTFESTVFSIESLFKPNSPELKLYQNQNIIGNYHIRFDYQSKSITITEVKTNLGDLNMIATGAISSIIRVDQLQPNVNIQNRTYISNYTLQKGTYSGKQFSNQGTFGDIASALAATIQNDDSNLEAYNIGPEIWVKTKMPGYRLKQQVLLVNNNNVTDFIKVENEDLNNILKLKSGDWSILEQWRAHYLNGGNTRGRSIFVDNTTLSEISIGDYLETNYAGIYNQVVDIVEDITVPNSTKSKIILTRDSDITEGETRVFNENVVNIGLFSAYDVYDMDFDFYDTSNSELKELSLETRENINYEPYENAILNIDPITSEFNTILGATDIFDDDYGLEPVNYFSNLSGILSEETIDEELSENITSEFDRLKENELKEFAINSRIVPNINKWVLKDSLNVKEQPYYLNTSEAFGRTNFSPDISASDRNKDDMTHEWFYMDKKPKYLKYDELNQCFSYINFIEGFELTTDLFKSTNNDYFDKFMISDGFEKNLNQEDITSIFKEFGEYTSGYLNPDDVNNTFFKTELKKKYTLIDGGDTNAFASTIFKGLKVVLKNRKEFANKTALDFVKSSEFNGYKFSIMLKTNTDVETNGIDFEVIQNKKFKFVIFFITIDLSDYWLKGNMNRKMLYELNHKIVYDHANEDYIYANTSFDGAINWNGNGIQNFHNFSGSGPFDMEGIPHFDGSVPNFDDQILLGENGLYGDILMDIHPDTPGNSIYKFSIYNVEGDNVIKIQGKPVNIDDPNDILDVEFLPNYLQDKIKYYYKNGGTNIHKVLLNKISINSVTEMINLNDDSVKYTTVEEDGTINSNRFTINFEDGNEIVKYATLSVEEDNDKPKSFKLFKGIIGYNLIKSDDAEYYPFLIRHNGSYTVSFKPVITFTDMYTHFKSNRVQSTADQRESRFESLLYKHSLSNSYALKTAKSYYNRYNRCGTTFNVGLIIDRGVHDSNWGIIKNHFYHKVNEINPNGITKLSESSDKLPLYPRINEITISKKDVNVFRSSWDSNYYTRALSGGNSEDIPGTLDNTEEKSYFGSTVMKIENEYDVTSFTYENVNSQEDLDFILKNDINKSEVIIFEDEDQIVADFYITDAAIRMLRNDGVLARINRYVNVEDSVGDKTTLVDDADFYINKNIIQKFVVDSISLFTRSFKGRSSSITNIAEDIRAGGFSPDNNFRFKSHKQKPMNFRLIYNKRLGYSYDIKPMIKIKS